MAGGYQISKIVFMFICGKQGIWIALSGAQVVEHPLQDREVAGSIHGRAITKALKLVQVATLLDAQHYKASTGFSSNIFRTTNIHVASLTNKSEKNDTGYLHEGRADNAAYRHDRHGDYAAYPQDGHAYNAAYQHDRHI